MKKIINNEIGEINLYLGETILTVKSTDTHQTLTSAMAEYWRFYSTPEHRNLPVQLPNERKNTDKKRRNLGRILTLSEKVY